MRFRTSLGAALLLCACAAAARADEMLAWDKVARATIAAERVPAPQSEEALDMVRAAIDDAVNATAPYGSGGPSADVAAAVAAHDVLVKLFPTRKARLDARLDKVRVTLDENVLEASAEAGHRAAESVLSSQWTWKRPVVHGRVDGLPPVKQMVLPLHKTSDPLPPPPQKTSPL